MIFMILPNRDDLLELGMCPVGTSFSCHGDAAQPLPTNVAE